MEQRRFIVFLALAMVLLIGWSRFVVPHFLPQPAEVADVVDKEDAGKKDAAKKPADKKPPADETSKTDEPSKVVEQPAVKPDKKPKPDGASKKQPRKTVVLGSMEPESGYFLHVELTSRGAAVQRIRLNDYYRIEDPTQLLSVVDSAKSRYRTLATSIHQIDDQLKKQSSSSRSLDWELVNTEADKKVKGVNAAATFRLVSPDGKLEALKTYRLERSPKTGEALAETRNNDPAGYQLKLDITLRNLSDAKSSVSYMLQGPIGVPLEDKDHARKFRDIKLGYFEADQADVPIKERSIETDSMTAAKIKEAVADNELDKKGWRSPLQYIGVDVQYFVALILPTDDQLKKSGKYVASAKPQLLKGAKPDTHSEVSVQLSSVVTELPAGGKVTHSYSLYAGPKRQTLLEPLKADEVLDLGTYFGWVARGMLVVLTFLHETLGAPYGLCIIMLTMMVRGGMFPLSRKQAVGAQKMKELQPKIAELKKKYANDKEKFARAQMELFSKNNYNPFAGCLPVFVQLPIFIGLYTALGSSIDLRMAPFMWVENLAAPDQLIHDIGFKLPFLGKSFNLLPLITIALFIGQQKMFMPPPTDEQSAMQQKMMGYMMIFMGFMFYNVPAGLCVYFIASSAWGMGERKLLDVLAKKKGDAPSDETTEDDSSDGGSSRRKPPSDNPPGNGDGNGEGGGGFFAKLLAQADSAGTQTAGLEKKEDGKRDKSGKSKRKKKRSRR
jgi:YidC/Oxa1 family membrane protein insertase